MRFSLTGRSNSTDGKFIVKLIRDIDDQINARKKTVVSIGNYDGVHLGHVRVIELLKERASKLGVASTIVTFEPHPHEFFSPENAPPRLLRWRDKVEKIRRAGIEQVVSLRFNRKIAQASAEDFVKNYLVDGLRVCHVVIGDDFRFGRKRSGDLNLMRILGKKWGFTVSSADTYTVGDDRVSSSRIRDALQNSDFDLASDLLGYRYCINGKVAHGDKRGRTIGFPTANIVLKSENIPVWGVYAVYVHSKSLNSCPGVANIGVRPTVGGNKILLEVHLFGFNEQIYGERIQVEFAKKIRSEKKFDSFEKLKGQIMEDAETAKKWFRSVHKV